MNNFAENQKQRRWNDLKTAVGTTVKQGNIGKGRMTLDELLLNVKGGDFSSLVCQTQIKTEEEKAFYIAKGYDISLTESELKEKFSLDTACVWYSPSISNRSMYFNEIYSGSHMEENIREFAKMLFAEACKKTPQFFFPAAVRDFLRQRKNSAH